MTDCPNGDIRDLLPDLVAGRLSGDARREVEAHAAGCADCRAELALLTAMRSTLRRAPAVDTAAIAAVIPAYRAPVRRSWAGWRAAAAVLLLAGGTSVAVLSHEGATPARPDTTVAVANPSLTAGPATPAAPVAQPDSPAVAKASSPAKEPAAHELALGSAVATDLSDRELSALLADIQSLDALPAADVVEPASAITPVPPKGTD